MNRLILLLVLGIIYSAPSRLVIAGAPWVADQPKEIMGQDRKMVFESKNLTHAHKWAVAKSARDISPADREMLHSLLKHTDRGDAWFYALTSIAVSRDQESVHVIGSELLRNDNRYFALALGLIGDERAIPYLKEKAESSSLAHVVRACRQGLRMLGARSPAIPASLSTEGPIRLDLSIATTNVQLGRPFDLKVLIRNEAGTATRVASTDVFLAKYLHAYSMAGDYVLPLDRFIDYEPRADSYPLLPPGGEIVLRESCVLDIETPNRKDWPEILESPRVFVLRAEGGTWAFDVAPADGRKTVDVGLVLVYQPVAIAGSLAARLNIESGDIATNRVVSNVLRISGQNP